jgi:hypothetical protein
MRLNLSTTLLASTVLAACAPPDRATAPTTPTAAAIPPDPLGSPLGSPSGLPTAVTRLLLERAARGLLYTSESDYPFVWFFQAGPVATPLTAEAFRTALGIAPDTPVEVVSLDDFFARHIERVDPADAAAVALVPRYRLLRETIRHAVRAPRVFRVGRIAIDCYVVGTDRDGSVVGLTTVAIET